MTPFLVFACFVALLVSFGLWSARIASKRRQYIRAAPLPKGLYEKLRERHPQLELKDCQLVAQGLRQFFMTHSRSGHKYVSMPSQVVDDLWHEFILHTRAYQDFCEKAFGRFFHHTPAAALGSGKQMNQGLRRCWWFACREDNINPSTPTRLPLLFALDAKLNIANGFRYAPDCSVTKLQAAGSTAAVTYCGGDFSSSSVDGSTDGFGDGSSGDGSGDGGDGGGCGGGCGGGGGD